MYELYYIFNITGTGTKSHKTCFGIQKCQSIVREYRTHAGK